MNIDDRMFDFKDYYSMVAERLPKDSIIVEVGLGNGASSLFLAQTLTNMKKSFKLYMIDSLSYGGTEQLNELIKNIVASGCAESIELMPLDSLNASCKFNDHFFDFVMLDSSHTYPQTKAEIKLWWSKVKDGCALAGHDIFSEENPGVREAVEEMIPVTYTREPLDETIFEPTKVLQYYQTEKGLGVWEATKESFVKLNKL